MCALVKNKNKQETIKFEKKNYQSFPHKQSWVVTVIMGLEIFLVEYQAQDIKDASMQFKFDHVEAAYLILSMRSTW